MPKRGGRRRQEEERPARADPPAPSRRKSTRKPAAAGSKAASKAAAPSASADVRAPAAADQLRFITELAHRTTHPEADAGGCNCCSIALRSGEPRGCCGLFGMVAVLPGFNFFLDHLAFALPGAEVGSPYDQVLPGNDGTLSDVQAREAQQAMAERINSELFIDAIPYLQEDVDPPWFVPSAASRQLLIRY